MTCSRREGRCHGNYLIRHVHLVQLTQEISRTQEPAVPAVQLLTVTHRGPAWGTSNLAPISRLSQEPWTHLSRTLHLRFPIRAGWGGDKKDRAEMATAGSLGAPLGPSLNLSRPWFLPVHNRNDSAAHTGVCCRDPRGHVCSAWHLLATAAVRSEFFCQGPHGRARLWGQTWAGILSPTLSHATLFIFYKDLIHLREND